MTGGPGAGRRWCPPLDSAETHTDVGGVSGHRRGIKVGPMNCPMAADAACRGQGWRRLPCHRALRCQAGPGPRM